jgi:hypothetical protein
MVVLLNPDALKNPEDANVAGMIDAIENMCAQYIMQWKRLPAYCYVSSSFWADAMFDLLPTTDQWGLTVVPCNIPYDRVSLHADYKDPLEIARYHRRVGQDDDGIESGLLEIV